MSPLYTVSQIRTIETTAAAQLPPGTLMQRAGHAAAKLALELLKPPHGDAKVLILAGPGNNGGDALEVALHLAEAGVQVSVLLLEAPQSGDAVAALQRAQTSSAQFLDSHLANETSPSHSSVITSTRWHLVVDGLFGIGLSRPISGSLRNLVAVINRFHCPILALDIPSGLDADTGTVLGHHLPHPGIAVRADHTITFIGDKPGLHTCDGRDYAGQVHVAKLNIDHHHFPQSHMQINGEAAFGTHLRPRLHNSHKGSYGNVAVVGGARGMAGAVILAARTALYCGAGRVYAGFIDLAPAYDSQQPELMCRHAHELDFEHATLLLGPGLGNADSALAMLRKGLASPGPMVLDADALNLIAADKSLQQQVAARTEPCILTPHPLEAARLLHCSSAQVQADRLAAARQLAAQFACTVIVKGSGSVIANAHQHVAINPTGNPGLAAAGTGDVLSGICAALLAQSWPDWEAALFATWVHGKAADMLVEQGHGPMGLCASELLATIRLAMNSLVCEWAENHPRAHFQP